MNRSWARTMTPMAVGLLMVLVPVLAEGQKTSGNPKPSESVDKAVARAQLQIAGILINEPSLEDLIRIGDSFKGRQEYEQAMIYYLIAARESGSLAQHARYQLACNLALWGNQDVAMEQLKKAVDGGFWNYGLMRDDDELDSLRTRPGFAELEETVKKRYPEAVRKHAGQPVVKYPGKEAQEAGKSRGRSMPVLVALHGYGSNPQDFAVVAQLAADNGMIGLSLPGTVVLRENSFRWSNESIEHTHAYVQNELGRLRLPKGMRLGPVYVTGFSQGGLHAALLTMHYSKHYAGAMPVSPGGSLDVPRVPTGGRPRPLFMIYSTEEHPGNIALARSIMTAFQTVKFPVDQATHRGGHEFPEDWREVFKKGLEFLACPSGPRCSK